MASLGMASEYFPLNILRKHRARNIPKAIEKRFVLPPPLPISILSSIFGNLTTLGSRLFWIIGVLLYLRLQS